MKKPFFSVIVPAHNSEKYIEKCLHSIAIQTFLDFELIVICDACTDRTFIKARNYDLYVPEITVVETDYGMDGLARNKGIELARGTWIMFLDDDDWWIHEYVLEEIHKTIENIMIPVQMILFDFIWKNAPPHKSPYYVQDIDNVNIAVWSKAFRRDLIGDTRFPAIPFTSDKPFMDEICAKRPVAYPMRKLMYYYNYMRKGSQTEEHERGRAE